MKKIWINGCFDILHIGHISLIEWASKLDEETYVVIGIDGDDRVKKLKGDKRPVNGEYERRIMLESLKYVDEVIVFNSKYELLKIIKQHDIDIMVVGEEYKDKHVIGCEYAKVIYYPKVKGYSTTNYIEKIKNL